MSTRPPRTIPTATATRTAGRTMRIVEETIRVKGAPDQTLTLKFTRHGPVIREDAANRRAFAVRSVWFEPGAAPYAVSLSSMRAKDYASFREDMKRWSVPAINMVYADTHGDIAWIAAGYSPLRRNWDGLLPVPGDGRFEWDGFLTAEQLPHVRNPEAGFFATANEMNIPAGWPHDKMPVGYEWYDRARATRLGGSVCGDRGPHGEGLLRPADRHHLHPGAAGAPARLGAEAGRPASGASAQDPAGLGRRPPRRQRRRCAVRGLVVQAPPPRPLRPARRPTPRSRRCSCPATPIRRWATWRSPVPCSATTRRAAATGCF